MKPSEKGVALLTVLLLVAVMSTIAVMVIDDIRFAIRRSANGRTLGQAQWYALGAESMAKTRLRALFAQSAGRVTLDGGWSGTPVLTPIDQGSIRILVSDRGACFNLNSVVSQEGEGYVANPVGLAEFEQLLTALDIPALEAEGLADALLDWIDTDSRAEPLGAEDPAYLNGEPSYRTSGQLLAEETELRAIKGFTQPIYDRIRPYVCALPLPQLTDVNINTLKAADAPVLSALYMGRLPIEAARQIIASRPAGGWTNQSAFLEQPLLQRASAQGAAPPIQQLVLTSRFFALDAQVDFAGAELPFSALLEAHPSGELRTVSRRWTAEE